MTQPKNTKALSGALAALAFAAMAMPAWSSSDVAKGNGALSARAYVDFQVTVPRVMQMRLVAHPSSIDVTAEDVARGSIRVSGPALDLLVNDRNGYAIRADVSGDAFNAVKISGLSETVVATQAGALIRMASMVGKRKPAPMPVEYELQLSPNAQPGHYAWPLTLSLQQL